MALSIHGCAVLRKRHPNRSSRTARLVLASVVAAAVFQMQLPSVFLSAFTGNGRGQLVPGVRGPSSGPCPQQRTREVSLNARGGADPAALAVGTKVKAVSSDDEQWYLGVIEGSKGDGVFVVRWDDPDGGPETEEVNADSINVIVIFKDYKVGEAVEAAYPDDGNMYPGTVAKINADGTFNVKWDDADGGPEESPCKPEDMKYPPIPIDKLVVGQKYKGTVRSVLDFGAFVDIGAEGDGLLHISRISEERVNDVRDYVQEDQEVDVWVSEVRDDGKFGVSMVESKVGSGSGGGRAPADLTSFASVSPDEWQTGTVSSIMGFGAFVRVTLPDGASADGLVHVSQIKDAFVENIEDEVSVGQEVQVRIIRVDLDAGKMSLSMKEGFGGGGGGGRAPADLSAFEGVDSEQFLDGKVARLTSFGAFVSVTSPSGDSTADGLVHITQIKDGYVESVEDELEEGQDVKVRVISVENGKMSLSMISE